jgi:tRNA (mo5U34)-methyltransferase
MASAMKASREYHMDKHDLAAASLTRKPVAFKTIGSGLHKARRMGLHKVLPASARRALASRFGARLNSISPGLISPGALPSLIATANQALTSDVFERAQMLGFWFHSIPFPDGRITAGNKSMAQQQHELRCWQFPADLTGKTMIDIGCADGFYSIVGRARGAARVLSIDDQQTMGLQFLLENKVYPIEYRKLDVMSPEFADLEPFDFVHFAGVFYHLQNPVEAFKRVRRITREVALIEGHINETYGRELPYAVYYEGSELNNDPTNWWGPNLPCLEAMIRTAGFSRYQLTGIVDERAGNKRASFLAYP